MGQETEVPQQANSYGPPTPPQQGEDELENSGAPYPAGLARGAPPQQAPPLSEPPARPTVPRPYHALPQEAPTSQAPETPSVSPPISPRGLPPRARPVGSMDPWPHPVAQQLATTFCKPH